MDNWPLDFCSQLEQPTPHPNSVRFCCQNTRVKIPAVLIFLTYRIIRKTEIRKKVVQLHTLQVHCGSITFKSPQNAVFQQYSTTIVLAIPLAHRAATISDYSAPRCRTMDTGASALHGAPVYLPVYAGTKLQATVVLCFSQNDCNMQLWHGLHTYCSA